MIGSTPLRSIGGRNRVAAMVRCVLDGVRRQRLRYTVSLKENRQFRRLYAKGNHQASGLMVIYYRKTKGKENRLGITVSGKLGNAVVRNKLRRRLREAYRTHEDLFLPGSSIVIVARHRAKTASYRDLTACLLRLSEKAGLLRRAEDRP